MTITTAADRPLPGLPSARAAKPAPALVTLAVRLLALATSRGVRFGARKVFLATIPALDLTSLACLATLDQLRRVGLLRFARADLVAAMDPTIVAASEWILDRSIGATVHFLVLPDVEQGALIEHLAARAELEVHDARNEETRRWWTTMVEVCDEMLLGVRPEAELRGWVEQYELEDQCGEGVRRMNRWATDEAWTSTVPAMQQREAA